MILALLFASALPASATIVTTLVGPNALDAQLTSSSGTFAVTRNTVTAADAWVFWEAASAETDDCDVVLDAQLPAGGEVGVVLRASWAQLDMEGLDGYLVVAGAGKLRVERIDGGVATVLGTAELPAMPRLRLTVAMHGTHLEAHVGEVQVMVTDGRHIMGRVGLRVHGGPNNNAVTVDALRLGLPHSTAEVPPSERVPSGDLRLVVVDDADLPRLDPTLSRWSAFNSRLGSRPRTALVMNAKQRTVLAHAGVVPISVTSDVPWRAFAQKTQGGAGGYLDVEGVAEALRGLAAAHPDVARVEEIGRSLGGKPLLALVISDGAPSAEPAFLLNGAHHGSELMSVDSVIAAASWLLANQAINDDAARIVHDAETWCVPLVNPDGLAAFFDHSARAGRKNGRDVDGNGHVDPWDGVDLNRNYPFEWGGLGERASRRWSLHRFFRGKNAASEPETQAMIRIARERRFVAAISFHTLSTVLLAPYTVRGVRSPEPDAPLLIAQTLVGSLPPSVGQRAFKVGREIYAVDGTDQDWHRHENGTLSYILEGRRHNTLDPRARTAILDEERALWLGLFLRVLRGPTLRMSVRDAEGHPLDAVVNVDPVRSFQGERWRTRSADGSFFFPLDVARALKVSAEANGFIPRTVDVAVGALATQLTLSPVSNGKID